MHTLKFQLQRVRRPLYFVCNDYYTYSVIIILSEFELIEKWLSHVLLGEKRAKRSFHYLLLAS